MRLQTLSAYRLTSKAITTNRTFTTSNGVSFSIFVSKDSDSLVQYYIVESHWQETAHSKIIPLAQIQLSKTTGKMKVTTFQPENWNLKISTEEFMQYINECAPDLFSSDQSMTLIH